MQPFEGNGEADVVPGGNEFDTPALEGDFQPLRIDWKQFHVENSCHFRDQY